MSWLFKSTVKIWVNWMSGCWEKFVWWCCDVVGGCYNSRIDSLQVLLTFDFGLRLGLGLRQQLKFNFRKNTFLQKKQNLSFKIYLWKTIFITFHKTVICIPWCQKHFALQNISFISATIFLNADMKERDCVSNWCLILDFKAKHWWNLGFYDKI